MDSIVCRQLRPDEATIWVDLHNTHFPYLTYDEGARWVEQPDVAVVGAWHEGRLVGGIPFHVRNFLIRPGVTIRGAFEHAVLVHESVRDRGVGSAMMAEAKRCLADRCDALMVYRGGETSDGYRFYTRTGHHDLNYLRPHYLAGTTPADVPGVARGTFEDILTRQEAMDRVFQSAYGAFGGFPRRVPHFWELSLDSLYFDMHAQECAIAYTESGSTLTGYAVVAREYRERKIHKCAHLLELATLGGDPVTAEPLIRAAVGLAAGWGVDLRAYVTDADPYVGVIRAAGLEPFTRERSSMMTMAHIIDVAAMAPKVWRQSDATADLTVTAWTPLRQAVLHQARSGEGRAIQLEMKDETLTRLLFSRLDLASALEQEIVTAAGGTDRDLAAIAEALPFYPWAYHHIDYI